MADPQRNRLEFPSEKTALKTNPPAITGQSNGVKPDESPLSLRRLRDAFAAMLKPQENSPATNTPPKPAEHRNTQALHNPCETNPRSVIEAMLFVGRPDNGAMSARELAAAMRGVSPAEIDAVIRELNTAYEQDGAPYAVMGSSNGYRLELLPEFGRVRDRFFGRVREARLSPAALEVLAIVAYHQPVTVDDTNQLRGSPSGPILATLVRRQLLRIDRPEQRGTPPLYSTTPRFLRLMGLESLSALPRTEELEKL
jgi:segregation and condensation protein B